MPLHSSLGNKSKTPSQKKKKKKERKKRNAVLILSDFNSEKCEKNIENVILFLVARNKIQDSVQTV